MDRQAQRDIRRKLNCLRFAQERRSNVLACRKFGVSKSSFYRWKAGYREKGEAGLINSRPCPENPALRTPVKIEEKFCIYADATTLALIELRGIWSVITRLRSLARVSTMCSRDMD